MAVYTLDSILKQAARLSAAERLSLAARLIDEVRREIPTDKPSALKWRDLQGALPYPALGEDAQAYVSRSRSESTQQREGLLKREL